MYELLEKRFKKNNPYKKYIITYWIYCFILIIVGKVLNIIFKINDLILELITVLIFIISVFMFIYFKIKKHYGKEKFKKHGFINLLKAYVQNLNLMITENLITILKENNINSKDKLKILIDYYSKKEPISVKSGFNSIIADLFVTIASIVVIAYNGVIGTLNTNMIINILYYSFGITMIVVLPVILIKYIFKAISPGKEYYNSSLLEELTYIYINFERYESRLK